jgi:hypothetical protein
MFGAVDSYRLVQLAYLLNDTPIPPVVYREMSSDNHSYYNDYVEYEELYRILKADNRLVNVRLSNSLQQYEGSIIFMLDEKEDIINTGIVLKDNYILTAFGERAVKYHSEEALAIMGDGLDQVVLFK